jgi:3-oxoacyl-[acyl-carrier protein] reductase
MSDRFSGKGFVVTGGTRGIGRAVVRQAVAEGAHVLFCGRTAPDDLEAEIRALAGRAVFTHADVAVESDVDRLFDLAAARLPAVDVLVNSAGITRDALLVQTELDDWNAVLAVNLRGPFLTCRRAVDEMLAQGHGGRIVNVGSFTANGLAGAGAYAASKSALVALGRSIAKEYGRRAIACNTVVPGFVDTDMTRDYDAGVKARIAAVSPHRRFATAAEIAEAILFLASEQASFITGDAVSVSGGVRDMPKVPS